MVDQPDKKILSLKQKPLDEQELARDQKTIPTRKRTAKRVIRRDELIQGALGRTKAATYKPTNKKAKLTTVSTPVKPTVSPSDLRLAALDKNLSGAFTIWSEHLPLALGIEKGIFRFIAAHHISASKRVVQKLLQHHTTSRLYQDGILKHAQRYELDGTPAGLISQVEKDYAQRQVDVVHSAKV